MANIKLSSHNWETSGIYDLTQGKTQRQINSDLNGAITNKVLYYRNQTLTTASDAQILRIDDSALTGDHCLCELFVTDPSSVNGEITWRTYDGYMTLSGTCTAATNVNILLVKTDKLVT